MKMTTEEAFVKVLQRHGIDNAFIGSIAISFVHDGLILNLPTNVG